MGVHPSGHGESSCAAGSIFTGCAHDIPLPARTCTSRVDSYGIGFLPGGSMRNVLTPAPGKRSISLKGVHSIDNGCRFSIVPLTGALRKL